MCSPGRIGNLCLAVAPLQRWETAPVPASMPGTWKQPPSSQQRCWLLPQPAARVFQVVEDNYLTR